MDKHRYQRGPVSGRVAVAIELAGPRGTGRARPVVRLPESESRIPAVDGERVRQGAIAPGLHR